MRRFCCALFILFHTLTAYSVEFPKFDRAMGKGTTAWDFIRTPEDKQRLGLFKARYESYQIPVNHQAVPKIIHWIWLGPKPLPHDSIRRMKRWIELHPGWTFQLWTDQKRNGLPAEIKTGDVLTYLGSLADCYFNSDNFGEKSEILRLCLLLSEGGIYVDHDVEPLRSFDSLASDFTFFCGLETLKPTILSSSIYPATHLIGSAPDHPIIKGSIDWLIANWDRLERQFPGSDDDAIANRVKHRGFRALSQGVMLHDSSEGSLVFPSSFFSESHPEKAIYATHLHSASWLNRSEGETVRRAFLTTEQEISWWLIASIGLGVCNLGICLWFLNTFRKLKQQRIG